MPHHKTTMSPSRAQWNHIGFEQVHEKRTTAKIPQETPVASPPAKPMAVKTPTVEVNYTYYPEPTD